jgi:hypothetical protein
MATKRERMYEAITQHGTKLQALFGLSGDPVELSKKLHSIEVKAHRYAEQECSGEIEQSDERDKQILDAVDKITGFRAKGIPVFLNGDPRGYALKIDDAYMRQHNVDLHKDWGGYGIIAPDFAA